jgi:phosphate starvation-inducible protein PhoH
LYPWRKKAINNKTLRLYTEDKEYSSDNSVSSESLSDHENFPGTNNAMFKEDKKKTIIKNKEIQEKLSKAAERIKILTARGFDIMLYP